MRCVVEPGRSLGLLRLALLATISVAAVSCSDDTHRFQVNPFASSPPSREVTGSVTPPPQRHSAVQSQPLPPPPGSAPATRPAAPPPPKAASAPPGWNWNGGTAIIVQKGDTIDGLVARYGVPASAIADANNLPNGTALRPGQRLVIPKYEVTGSTTPRAAVAPGQPAPVAAAPATTGEHVHVVAPGETLMALSRKYHKPLTEIARANNIAPGTMVKIGDRIIIPGVKQQAAAVPGPKPPTPMAQAQAPLPPQVKPAPAQKVASVPAAAGAPTANVITPAAHNPEPPKTKADVTAAMPTFRWPVNGRVITAFGPRPSGEQNDGINVSVPEGTPIKAAEDGVVAYAGNELKTYGNLVLVRHANGYVTAYAHASEILVKRDEQVKRGQVIAKAGQTGNVSAPQVHFEIRKNSTPVDPAPFLDKGGRG
jgi:murein DD-endopeptidase MepM/ murein hydrolase activator NlpD